MKKPDLTKIIKKMEGGNNFVISGSQYQDYTGTDIPKKKYYAEKQSAIAKKAKEMGYKIVLTEKMEFIKEGKHE